MCVYSVALQLYVIYRRVIHFQGYKIWRIVDNLLETKIFVDKFSRMKVISIVATTEQRILWINIFEALYLSTKSSKIFILENSFACYMLVYMYIRTNGISDFNPSASGTPIPVQWKPL